MLPQNLIQPLPLTALRQRKTLRHCVQLRLVHVLEVGRKLRAQRLGEEAFLDETVEMAPDVPCVGVLVLGGWRVIAEPFNEGLLGERRGLA